MRSALSRTPLTRQLNSGVSSLEVSKLLNFNLALVRSEVSGKGKLCIRQEEQQTGVVSLIEDHEALKMFTACKKVDEDEQFRVDELKESPKFGSKSQEPALCDFCN